MIHYKEKAAWRYQLVKTKVVFETGIIADVGNYYVSIPFAANFFCDGRLQMHPGYCWDGPSIPGKVALEKMPWVRVQIHKMLRASLAHDALYQLMRLGLLGGQYRKDADRVFRDLCIEDGVPRLIAWIAYQALVKFGFKATLPDSEPKVQTAP